MVNSLGTVFSLQVDAGRQVDTGRGLLLLLTQVVLVFGLRWCASCSGSRDYWCSSSAARLQPRWCLPSALVDAEGLLPLALRWTERDGELEWSGMRRRDEK